VRDIPSRCVTIGLHEMTPRKPSSSNADRSRPKAAPKRGARSLQVGASTLVRKTRSRVVVHRAPRTAPAAQKRESSKPREIGVGVIGLGFMGRTHIRAYSAARDAGYSCRLVAVCDRDAARLEGKIDVRGNISKGSGGFRLFDPKEVRATNSIDEFLADERFELVSVCTPTHTHVEIAKAALAAGKHVLVEKPVSLDPDEIAELEAVAKRAKRLCLPAMCMRFWPGWSWLKDKIESGELGAVRSAVFRRLSGAPDWSPEFYRDPRLTGGALFDLHIHDADVVHWLFGAPKSVVSTGSIDHVTTLYRYSRGPRHVVAEGGWDHTRGFAFRMTFVVVFEHATAEFSFAPEPALTLSRDGRRTNVKLDALTGYDGEIRHALDCVRAKHPQVRTTLSGARAVTRCLRAEAKSLESGRSVEL